MARKIIVVTAAYGNDHVKALGGQSAVLPFIAGSGADGVEIRRELFSADELNRLAELAADIERRGLLVCYSAPEALFAAEGALNPPSSFHVASSTFPVTDKPCSSCSARTALSVSLP